MIVTENGAAFLDKLEKGMVHDLPQNYLVQVLLTKQDGFRGTNPNAPNPKSQIRNPQSPHPFAFAQASRSVTVRLMTSFSGVESVSTVK